MKKIAFLLAFLLSVAFVNAQTRTEIKQTNLPKAINDNIALNYSGFTVQRAYKVVKENVTSYEVIVNKGSEKDRLYYDASGVFWKKEPMEHLANKQPATNKSHENMNKQSTTSKTSEKKN
jgi:hypothetical protein